MEDITTILGRLCTLLEDAIEEKDWERVEIVAKELDELYEDLDKQDDFLNDY